MTKGVLLCLRGSTTPRSDPITMDPQVYCSLVLQDKTRYLRFCLPSEIFVTFSGRRRLNAIRGSTTPSKRSCNYGSVIFQGPITQAVAYRTREQTGGRWFDAWLGQYSCLGLMIVIVTGFIPLSLLSIVSTMV